MKKRERERFEVRLPFHWPGWKTEVLATDAMEALERGGSVVWCKGEKVWPLHFEVERVTTGEVWNATVENRVSREFRVAKLKEGKMKEGKMKEGKMKEGKMKEKWEVGG